MILFMSLAVLATSFLALTFWKAAIRFKVRFSYYSGLGICIVSLPAIFAIRLVRKIFSLVGEMARVHSDVVKEWQDLKPDQSTNED